MSNWKGWTPPPLGGYQPEPPRPPPPDTDTGIALKRGTMKIERALVLAILVLLVVYLAGLVR